MVIRYAKTQKLQRDVLRSFDSLVNKGWKQKQAAWGALYDWRLLDDPEVAGARV